MKMGFGFKKLELSDWVFLRVDTVDEVIIAVYGDELIIISMNKPKIDDTNIEITFRTLTVSKLIFKSWLINFN